MANTHSKETRSYNMSKIKSKNTKPEILVRKFLFSKGFRYKIHDKKRPGKPDIVLPKYKPVILVNGCFWHGHLNCKYFVMPKSRITFWQQKIERNKTLDIQNRETLKKLRWNVIEIFECELKKSKVENTLNNLLTQFGK